MTRAIALIEERQKAIDYMNAGMERPEQSIFSDIPMFRSGASGLAWRWLGIEAGSL
ncbi:hypothetical protein [Salmonella bongori]|uniref:hypothetical protein n=1 Tax=Salmonella bongori TaxID=54736 RepID=UPI0035560073